MIDEIGRDKVIVDYFREEISYGTFVDLRGKWHSDKRKVTKQPKEKLLYEEIKAMVPFARHVKNAGYELGMLECVMGEMSLECLSKIVRK